VNVTTEATFSGGMVFHVLNRGGPETAFGEERGHCYSLDIQCHPQIPLATGQTTPCSVRLTIMTLAWSTSDRAKASRADGVHPSVARRNRAEVVVADEVGVYQSVQRVVHRAFLCGVDPLSRATPTIIADPGFGTAWSRWPGSSASRSRRSR
jgi:hypothetical protein